MAIGKITAGIGKLAHGVNNNHRVQLRSIALGKELLSEAIGKKFMIMKEVFDFLLAALPWIAVGGAFFKRRKKEHYCDIGFSDFRYGAEPEKRNCSMISDENNKPNAI